MHSLDTQGLAHAILFLAVIGTIKRDSARYEGIPVGSMLYDMMKVGYLLEKVLDTLFSFDRAVSDQRLPALSTVKRNDIAHRLASLSDASIRS
ncbi:MAG: hypothetical protein Rhirs2KO_20060 [Rhizobiaceae bacterium]